MIERWRARLELICPEVGNRGIERREIFRDERSFEHFLELLSNMPERFAIKIHA